MTTPDNSGEEQENRDARGRWKPGASGNPAGCPRGSRHRAVKAAEALLDGEAETLTRKAIELAKDGDTVALRLCLDRLLPPRKERPIETELPIVESIEDLPQVTSALLEAAASGALTPSEATELAKLTEAHRKAIETAELEQRIAQLEQQIGDRG